MRYNRAERSQRAPVFFLSSSLYFFRHKKYEAKEGGKLACGILMEWLIFVCFSPSFIFLCAHYNAPRCVLLDRLFSGPAVFVSCRHGLSPFYSRAKGVCGVHFDV